MCKHYNCQSPEVVRDQWTLPEIIRFLDINQERNEAERYANQPKARKDHFVSNGVLVLGRDQEMEGDYWPDANEGIDRADLARMMRG